MSASQTQTEPLLPGRDRPLDYVPRTGDPFFIDSILFQCLLDSEPPPGWRATLPLITVRELTMLQWMDELTDESEWNIKLNDAKITDKWKEEVLASGKNITKNMVDWCIAELQYKASLIPTSHSLIPPPIVVYNGDVVKSDHSISAEFREDFKKATSKFEDRIRFAKRKRDIYSQPGSDDLVFDLVHPDAFPLVYGRTRILDRGVASTTLDDCVERCGEGSPVDPTPPNDNDTNDGLSAYSRKFQWLPCEVDISGDEPRITSYINNLHPICEKELYTYIESIIKPSIPLWERSLSPLGKNGLFYKHGLRISYDEVLHGPLASETTKDDDEEPKHEDEDDTGSDQDIEDGEEGSEDEDSDYTHLGPIEGPLVLPEPESSFSPLPTPPPLSFKECYGAHGLQVIVKIQNIELTPEKPLYDEDLYWHGDEDRLNEHIVATSIYSYSNNNITPPRLSFKQFFDPKNAEEEVCYRPGDRPWLKSIFGCLSAEREKPEEADYFSSQNIGSVEMREGRLISFPNILLDMIEPMRLVDETQRGWCKLVTLFLVDPNIKIISTKHVPCQRLDWWWEPATATSPSSHAVSRIKRIPVELEDQILSYVDFPLSLRDAREIRNQMFDERENLDRDFHNFLETNAWSVNLF